MCVEASVSVRLSLIMWMIDLVVEGDWCGVEGGGKQGMDGWSFIGTSSPRRYTYSILVGRLPH